MLYLPILAMFALYVLGVWWCYEVIARFRDDVEELREVKETSRRAAIIIVWGITVIIAVLLVGLTIVMAARAISEWRGW